jgi:hypothetical protein
MAVMTRVRAVLLSALTCLALGAGFSSPAAEPAPPRSIAVFEFELIDTSGEPERAEHRQRLHEVTEEMRRLLAERGFRIVDLAPAAERIAQAGYLHGCNGCEADIAAELGADLALRGTVNKVSTLILYVTVAVTDAHTSIPLRVASVSIRGDTDTAWLRGVRYLVRERLADLPQTPPAR